MACALAAAGSGRRGGRLHRLLLVQPPCPPDPVPRSRAGARVRLCRRCARRRRQAAGRDRGARGGLPATRASDGAGGARAARRGERRPLHAQAPAADRCRRCGDRDRRGARRAGALTRSSARHWCVLRDALAARRSARRRARQASAARRDRARDVLHRLRAGGGQGAARLADRRRSLRAVPARSARAAPRLGAGRRGRVLEDLHARGLCDRALPQADLPGCRARPGADLPLPLLDLRPDAGRQGDLRPRWEAAAAVASSGVLRAAGNFSGPVGPSWSGVRSKRPRNPS